MIKENSELVKNKDNLNVINKEPKKHSSSDKELERSDTKDFANRLSILLDKLNKKPHAFALEANIPVQTFYKHVGGISEPSRPIINAIIKTSGVNPEWLLTGNGPMMKSEALSPVPSKNLSQENSLANSKPYTITNLEGRQVEYRPNPDLCHIPVLSLEAACGNGIFIEGESVSAVFSATRLWFKRELGHSPENLCLIQVRGDSMTDTIMPNEFVFIDRSSILEPCDSIWAFRNENSLFVKRLQFLPNNQIEVSSDNSHYKSYTIIPDHNFSLLGRVIATLPLRRL